MAITYPKYEGKGADRKCVGTDVQFEGCVLETRERNGYHDSDFYAVVWDEEKGSTREIEYATTRFAGGGNATVDATEETWAKVGEFCKGVMIERVEENERAKARDFRKGMRVRVRKGRKVPIGTEGVIFWIGQPKKYGYYDTPRRTLGIATSDRTETVTKHKRNGDPYTVEQHIDVEWVADSNCEIIEPDSYIGMPTDLKHIARACDQTLYRMYRGWLMSLVYRTGTWRYVA